MFIHIDGCEYDCYVLQLARKLSFRCVCVTDDVKMNNVEEWQESCESLMTRSELLLKNGLLTDCKFVFDCEPEQITIESHKLFLAMTSPVFQAMFYGSMESADTIKINDIEPQIFKALLTYIYTDEIDIEPDKAFDLYYVAKKYMIPHLARECTDYLKTFIIPSNVCQIYELAKFFNEPSLLIKCRKVISYYTTLVLSDDSFLNIKLETMIEIFQMDDLFISNELDLFDAAVRYSNARLKQIPLVKPNAVFHKPIENDVKTQKNLDNTNDETNTNSETLSVRDAIKHIKFLLLTPKEFAEGPGKSDLLTRYEIITIAKKLSFPDADIEMPEGFSTSQETRRIECYTIYPASLTNSPSAESDLEKERS